MILFLTRSTIFIQHLIVAFIRLVQGLQPGDGDQDLSAAGALYDISYKVKIALYFFQTILADGLMVKIPISSCRIIETQDAYRLGDVL